MRRIFGCALALALAGTAGAFTPTGPVSPAGVKAVVDLPAGQHMKNVGGSDGAGLCVFTSVEHSGRWQSIRELDGFQAWMRRRPGGGWPEKLDDMLARFCRETGAKLPPYIQHTGGDAEFLEAALATDRMPCVTYAGRDDFYRGRIAHMVNLAHLDGTSAAIVDNNRPGVWLWMTRKEFLDRWRDMQGGWAVVFLAAPPPPHKAGAKAFEAKAPACICGDACKCSPGECPAKCPVAFGQCENGRCRPLNVYPSVPVIPVQPATTGPEPIGSPPSERHEWGMTELGYGWKLKAAAEAPPVAEATENYGVDLSKIQAAPKYSFKGVEITRAASQSLLAGGGPLADDSDRWHLTAVGTEDYRRQFKAAVEKLPEDVKAKLLVKDYGPGEWPVPAFDLPNGVSLRAPSPARESAQLGVCVGCSLEDILKLLQLPGGPLPAPKPAPVDPTKPVDPANPTPAPADGQYPWWICAIVAVVLWLTKKPSAQR